MATRAGETVPFDEFSTYVVARAGGDTPHGPVARTPEVLGDFDRIFDHLAQFEIREAPKRISEIVDAIHVPSHSPPIGRKVKGGMREIVIGRSSHGNVALYRYVSKINVAFMLALRAQRESSYKRRGG
jgi:toxin ParE1/3/4